MKYVLHYLWYQMVLFARGNKYLFRFRDSNIYFPPDSFQKVAGMVFLRITSWVESPLILLLLLLFYIQAPKEEWESFPEMSLRLDGQVELRLPVHRSELSSS